MSVACLEELTPGDLVVVYWTDASIGTGYGGGSSIEIPVRSWGVYIGSFGEPQHLILSQNDFDYHKELRMEDYSAIPITWTTKVQVLEPQHVNPAEAETMLRNILLGDAHRRRRRAHQMRAKNEEYRETAHQEGAP